MDLYFAILAFTLAIFSIIIFFRFRNRIADPLQRNNLFLILGTTWMITGLLIEVLTIGFIGLIFFIIGITNKIISLKS
ncbi:MAG TPA: hypothetical protein PKA80_09325 [Ignavibacteriaceae bacterium]|nr:hypothetical protein [Ignavibacteriaceae bacterium]